ncbi:MAG TPA: Rieske (2Fe-2S) protein [Candidatus Limnocylindrales bacterium]|nr:Rieske (2Fe-2S) protein [Candidatus Limnocylindrales bacterium]
MIGRLLSRLVYANAGWATPLGNFNVRVLRAIYRPIRPIKDFLNGKWLGHSIHGALTDIPIGAFTLVILFDLLNLRTAADIALLIGVLVMVAAAVAGTADYSDTDDEPRMVATVHATLMTTALVVYVISVVLRMGTGETGDRTVAVILSFVGYAIVTAGAFVGGELVYTLGNMVNRHAWRFFGTPKWTKLDVTDIAEGVPTAAKAGSQQLVVVRTGSAVYALHAQCAHAGGPLAEGKLVDGCIECPWHYSRYRMSDGKRTQGPTTFDQPRYDVRAAEGGGWEVLRVTGERGQNP